MSAPPSPIIGPVAHDKGLTKRRDRPPTLNFGDQKAASDGDVRYERDTRKDAQHLLLRVHNKDKDMETETETSRSDSATSSLDPYYFSAQSPSESPVPALLDAEHLPKTPEMCAVNEPVTPGKDLAAIDRRGLVGVGELATPRWTRGSHHEEVEIDEPVSEVDEQEVDEVDNEFIVEELERDMPDSPWTIEAVDGEPEEQDEFVEVKAVPRSLRSRPSMADESGGEEILYPRHAHPADDFKRAGSIEGSHDGSETVIPDLSLVGIDASFGTTAQERLDSSPPSAFPAITSRPRKRTSDEFEMDQVGNFIPTHSSALSTGSAKEKASVRRHRSLVLGPVVSATPRDKLKDRRRDTLSVNVKHSRQTSTSSSSSSHGENHHSRRAHASDFSHLPPSPSTSSIQQFLKHGGSTATSPSHNVSRERETLHSSVHVAHSLLRGTQEGWSDLDDQSTVEALRKLDGLSGRSARARSSIGAHSRLGSSSRPSTPATASSQWEGVEGGRGSKRTSTYVTVKDKTQGKEQHSAHRQNIGPGIGAADVFTDVEVAGFPLNASEDTCTNSQLPEKPLKKSNSINARGGFATKRGSASSGTYTSTPTTSSRDSATLSISTNATSVSTTSGRQSSNKGRRNSAGSDMSAGLSVEANHVRDRAAALPIPSDAIDDNEVPPVPPLPKDFKLPSQGSVSAVTSPPDTIGASKTKRETVSEATFQTTLDVPIVTETPSKHASMQVQESATPTAVHKTPSKKWSFSNALGKKLSNSPSTSSMKESAAPKSPGFPITPRSLSFGAQLRKSVSREHPTSPGSKTTTDEWLSVNTAAMASATSLASVSSAGSPKELVSTPLSPAASGTSLQPPIAKSRTPDQLVPSRPGTASSVSTNVPVTRAPLSPSSSIRRGPSSKRLTPSSIPFFRRSSSQSMQVPPSNTMPPPPSPTGLAAISSARLRTTSRSPSRDSRLLSPSATGPSQKKSSVLSLGLPSLLKSSSSRRSLHSDKEKNDSKSGKEDQGSKSDKEKHKKDEKERSESRISVLMGRRRGKTVSSAQATPKKLEQVPLPPMQISALSAATAQRVASLKSSSTSLSSNPSVSSSSKSTSSSRTTFQTASSLQKGSDTSLRSRNQLPTIAGSPSVGSINPHATKESRDPIPSSSLNPTSSLTKETPTKIPRISSRSSTTNSPTFKANGGNRRASLLVGNPVHVPSRDTSPNVGHESTNEFGVFETAQSLGSKVVMASQRHSARVSPSITSRVPRQATAPAITTTVNGTAPRKNRDSMSFGGLRKSSTGSVASVSLVAPQNEGQSSHRFSALSPSKGLKLLSPKMSIPTSRSSNSSSTPSIHQAMASPSMSRQSLSTPSPAPSSVDEEEVAGDEEMLQYIRRQHAKKLATGATQEELDKMLRFPEPISPIAPISPTALLQSPQAQFLSEFEREEVLKYGSVYYIGAHSDKKRATLGNSTNNHGYDDERGDYLVVNHDHLAYRYEVIDTLGKGSFGQVLHCRDHYTGESVAVKIIRNKKRFHHQALVEIKILDSLRKWDQDEKHHVIKMTENFYFRGHLCIAMELLSINLYELIKANGFAGFTTALIRRFTSQMLQSLCLMRHHRIVHCDLKPENVLLRHPAKSAIKVIDFGSSCFEHEKIYTYIQSRFYRSPEVILGMNYHMAIDMWSLGCILAELYTGYPIFPGENEQEQLSCIMEVLGVPDKDFINRSSRKRLFFERVDTTGAPRPVVNSKGRRRRPGARTLAQVLRCDDEHFVDFISKCLVWDPEKRIKPQAALRHPFITAGRRSRITSPSATPSKSNLTSTSGFSSIRSSKQAPETPKKSMISAPTPLTARSTRTATTSTPSASTSLQLGSSRTYRTPQTQSMTSYHSSRTMVSNYLCMCAVS
ncbi:uncharacterized protein LAESUDRAFT_692333 [Laetiporus sulphureus 93-53]|uniref:dual-specificity kinase n=1 Tax=Laetiporus sulphureus 93-53 TaxID=1314785 RepID=A0A165HA78_9APHY|nr:uncharacterized protein LAESUDRAFT_692333 [Laetiporus sulphureus 93-53]KZT11457.1 hypothetical protein LAESUDRAFT_692333 [Laetiporus sulphureus 93-53]